MCWAEPRERGGRCKECAPLGAISKEPDPCLLIMRRDSGSARHPEPLAHPSYLKAGFTGRHNPQSQARSPFFDVKKFTANHTQIQKCSFSKLLSVYSGGTAMLGARGTQMGTQGGPEALSPPYLAVQGRESRASTKGLPAPGRGCSKCSLQESLEDQQKSTKQRVLGAKEQKVQMSARQRRFLKSQMLARKGLLVTVPRARAAVCPKVRQQLEAWPIWVYTPLHSLELWMSGEFIRIRIRQWE